MATPTQAPARSEPSVEYQEIIVKRDGNRPISFAGKTLAKVTTKSALVGSEMTAALFQTRGGKYIASFSRANAMLGGLQLIADPDGPPAAELHKAQVFESFDDAVAWFRPGRLTDALRKQLGLDEPERIE